MDQGPPASGGAMPPAAHPQRDPRRAVGLAARLSRGNGAIIPVTIRDLSYNGCGIVSTEALICGEALPLSVEGRGTIMVKVRWCDGLSAGLEFEPDTALARDEPGQVERVSPRIPARVQVNVRKPGGPMWAAEVTDVSPEGCCIGWVSRPRVDDLIWVKFDGLEALDARVCWVEGKNAGLQFTRPIHPAVFDLMIARLSGS